VSNVPSAVKFRSGTTPKMRFVERDGLKVLQEALTFVEYEAGVATQQVTEWHDVPTEVGV